MGLLLHGHDLQNLILEGRSQENLDDLRFLDGQAEEIGLLQGPELYILDQTAQAGERHPLHLLGLAAVNSLALTTAEAAGPPIPVPPEAPVLSATSCFLGEDQSLRLYLFF